MSEVMLSYLPTCVAPEVTVLSNHSNIHAFMVQNCPEIPFDFNSNWSICVCSIIVKTLACVIVYVGHIQVCIGYIKT